MITDFVFGIAFGFIFGYLWERCTTKTNLRRFAHLKRIHLHHSLFGLIAILFALLLKGGSQIIVLCFGLGIIIEHSIRESFVFITKDKNEKN